MTVGGRDLLVRRLGTVAILLLLIAAVLVPAAGAAAAAEENGRVETEELPAPDAAAEEPVPQRTAAARPVVVLDPGHGGGDPGETGAAGTPEEEVVLDIALRTAKLLDDTFEVILTRREDVALTHDQRSNEANYRDADVFVSIHLGASSAASANGVSIFVPSGTMTTPAGRTIASRPGQNGQALNRRLADQVASSIHASTASTIRGIHAAPCRVLEGLTMPAVLVETGFVTNPVEEELLAGESYRQTIAEGLAEGIRAFLASNR